MNGTDLEESDCFRLLGITFSRDFSWRPYIEAIAKSASMKVGSLLRTTSLPNQYSIFINLLSALALSIAVTSGVVLLPNLSIF